MPRSACFSRLLLKAIQRSRSSACGRQRSEEAAEARRTRGSLSYIRCVLTSICMFKFILRIFTTGYSIIIFLLFCCALALIFFSVAELWEGIDPTSVTEIRERFNAVLES